MAELIVMDPSEVATGRTEFNLTPWIKVDGLDYGDADIAAYMADQGYGSSPVDFRVPNRTIQIPLSLQTRGGTSFATVRETIQSKVSRWQQEGGWFKRVTSVGTWYCDVVNATLRFSGHWAQANKDHDVDAMLTLEALPDFYGNEIELSDHVETSAAELVFTESSVKGNYPSRVRLVVDEDQGQSQMGLMWCFQAKNYSSAATAALAYEAEALQPLDTATKAALSGASGGTVVTHSALATSWTPVLNLNLGGTAYLTHTGTYRLFCRYRTTSGTAVALRSVYDVGDLLYPEENDPWYHPASTAGTSFFIADLGELRLQQGPVGTHRWAGQIQAQGLVGSENVSLDRVWFQSVDEAAGLLRAPFTADSGLMTYSARDEFNQTAAALDTKVLPVGGTWATSGTTPDLQVNATDHVVTRTQSSADADINTGRYAVAGTATFGAVAVQTDLGVDNGDNLAGSYLGVLARYTASTDWVWATITPGTPGLVELRKRLASSTTVIASAPTWSIPFMADAGGPWMTLRLAIDTAGRYAVWFFPRGGSAGAPVLAGVDVNFASGTLASGKVGIYDAQTVDTTVVYTHRFDNFAAWVPSLDAVLHPSQSAELRTDAAVREDVSGTAYGPVSWVEGDLPRLPVSGYEGRTVRGMVKASRGDFDTLSDTGIDDISGKLYYRPCWINVPGS